MKKWGLLLMLLGAMHLSFAQVRDYEKDRNAQDDRFGSGSGAHSGDAKGAGHQPVLFVGVSTGMNNPTGLLGVNIEVPINYDFSIAAGVGTSTWGTKTTIEGKYFYRHRRKKMALGFGLTHNSGLVNVSESLATNYYGTMPVTLDLYPQTNIFVGMYRYFKLGHRANRFYIDAGLSLPLSSSKFDVTNGYVLTQQSSDVIKLLSPGGIMVGCGFDFGFYRD